MTRKPYPRLLLLLAAILIMLSLSNCGGGGGGGGDNDTSSNPVTARISLSKDNDSPIIGAIRFDGSSSTVNGSTSITAYHWSFGDGVTATGAVVSHAYDSSVKLKPYTATLTVTDSSGNTNSASIATTYNVSGTIAAASNSAVDIDVNDPSRQNRATLGTNFATNNNPSEAQRLPNPIALNGFVSASPSGLPPAGSSNFATDADFDDVYSAYLLQGQFVSVRVANYKHLQPRANDLDLYLYDDTLTQVATSFPLSAEFESVAVPADGEYFIRVAAYSGINKYILNIDNNSLVSGIQAYGNFADVIPGQAIVKLKAPAIINSANGSGTSLASNSTAVATTKLQPLTPLHGLAHHDHSRSTLMQFDLAAVTTKLNSTKQTANNSNRFEEKNPELIATLHHIKQLNLRDDVEYAEPNYRVKPSLIPNDSYYSYQWHYPQINLPQAWNISTGTDNPPVIVAVVDTGVVSNHEDLAGKLVAGYDFIRDTTVSRDGDGIDPYPEDEGDNSDSSPSSWHGTHVAGTIAAASNNNRGVAGVSWGAKIMPIRALGVGGGSSYDVIQGIRYAAGLSNDSGTTPSKAADIINLSLGGSGYSQTSQNLFNQLHDAGIIVVAAAGNENSTTPDYPASYDNVISVSATDHNNNLAPYSNFGNTISLAAPGGDASIDRDSDGYNDGILSTLFNAETGRDNYAFYEGTSMATPHIAGVAALMKDIYPRLTATEFTSSLQNNTLTNDAGEPGKDQFYGYGIIDALKAVQQAQTLAGGTITGSISASPNRIDFGRALNAQPITLSRYGNSPPEVVGYAKANSSTWLNIDNSSANIDGSGEYTLTVNRDTLSDAIYNDTITFTLDNATTVDIPVSMQVKTSSDLDADTGYLYILLLDADSYETIAQFSVDVIDGEYQYNFNHIPFGEYVIIAGSDIDNDFIICNLGESCGNYPTNDQPQRIIVDGNIENIDFLVSIMTDLISSSNNKTAKTAGFKRHITTVANISKRL
ncbi:MAG: S8 family serine peptidase [Spongiibacteraceae bacterium]